VGSWLLIVGFHMACARDEEVEAAFLSMDLCVRACGTFFPLFLLLASLLYGIVGLLSTLFDFTLSVTHSFSSGLARGLLLGHYCSASSVALYSTRHSLVAQVLWDVK
jgi:hypothetical protein